MKSMFEKITFAEVLALILIVGYMVLAWRGVATMLSSAVLLVIGFYYGNKNYVGDSEPKPVIIVPPVPTSPSDETPITK